MECNLTSTCKIFLYGGNLEIYDSSLDGGCLNISGCKKVSLLFNKNTILSDLLISSSSTDVSGNLKSYSDVEVKSDWIHLHNLNLETDNGKVYFLFPNLNMEDSTFESKRFLYFSYNSLNMQNILFSSTEALFFANIVGGNFINGFQNKIIIYYTKPNLVLLTDSDILSEKDQSIYSLLSILKGYSKKINDINDNDIKEITYKIDRDCALKIEDIKRKRAKLDEEIEILTQKANFSKEREKENLTNRKIKQLTYPKE